MKKIIDKEDKKRKKKDKISKSKRIPHAGSYW